MRDRTQFRNDVRDALAHFYDQAYLESHLLVRQLIGPNAPLTLSRAQMLRTLLREAIEALQPAQGIPSHMPEWRSYRALYYRYVKGVSFLQVQDELGLSRRQLQREERKGIDALVAMLWPRRLADNDAQDLSRQDPDETQPLPEQVQHWKVERQPCAVQALVDDVRWMLGPLLQRLNVTVEVVVPPRLAQVLVDPTLTRQAILRILRLLAQRAEGGKIALQAVHCDKMVAITFLSPVTVDLDQDDWHLASLLIRRQGGSLRIEPATGDMQRVVMEVPWLSRARVLVVDDVQAAHTLFERYLAPHNYDTIHASNADEAVRLAQKLRPDVVILDMMMPTVDGWQVLRDLQSHSTTATIPVVVCSVLDEPELALSLGAQSFVRKPVQRLELLAALERALAPLRQATAHS
jgi:CheY-like chemotaxis protein